MMNDTAEADDYRHALHVPAFAQHDDADNAIDGAFFVIHVAGRQPGFIQVFLRYLAALVGVNHQPPVGTEFRWVFILQPVSHVVGLRPYTAKANILPEQTVGRDLRLMFRDQGAAYTERVDVMRKK